MLTNYSVQIEEFAERHFIKSFQKKYKKQWDSTLISIIAGLERIDNLLLTDRAETICDAGAIKLSKLNLELQEPKNPPKLQVTGVLSLGMRINNM